MSFTPGVPLPMTRPLYATTTVPSRTMMVQMAPVRPVTMVPVSQMVVRPVMRPVISQSQGFVRTIQAQPMPQVMSNPVVQQGGQQIWIQQSSTQSNVVPSKKEEEKKEINSVDQTSNIEDSNEPTITVFIGNISDRASDSLVRQMLMKCGVVYNWKRVQGTSGKLQAFGFCEYRDPESALRAIYVLRDFMLGDKKLLVKVDAKTQDLIDEWKKEKGISAEEDSSEKPPGVDEVVAELDILIQNYAGELNTTKPTQTEEEEVVQILKPDPKVRESQNVEKNLQELELEEDQKSFISKEIRSFRETQKQQEEKLKSQKEKSESKSKKSSSSKEDRERSSSARDKTSSSSRGSRPERSERDRRERDRSPRSSSRRPRSPSPRRRDDSRRSSPVRRRRSRSPAPIRAPVRRSPPRRRTRSPPPRRRRSQSRSPVSWRRGVDDDDFEAQERRKLEKKIKEKEAAYQERLRLYETRERRQKRLHEKREERLATERKDMVKEAKRLREFLADYEDDRNDAKYYVGNALTKRLREREREIEADDKDRKKEKEEIEILRKRLAEENHLDPDAAIAKVIEESENIWRPLIEPDTPPRKTPPASPVQAASSSSSTEEDSDSDDESDAEKSDSDSSGNHSKEDAPGKVNGRKEQMVATLQPVKDEPLDYTSAEDNQQKFTPNIKSEPVVKMELGARSSPAQAVNPTVAALSPQISLKPEITLKKESTPELVSTALSSKRRKLTVSDVFNQDDEEDELPKKRKLVPLTYTEEERKALNPAKAAEDERKQAEKKRKMVRALIERIPTQKDDLFDFHLDWSMVDNSLMEKRIQPWITKKIKEYIGEDEPTLVEFICSKIMTKSSPEKILEDISMVLDDEADVFVVKMWRLLIYETEAKKEGLTK